MVSAVKKTQTSYVWSSSEVTQQQGPSIPSGGSDHGLPLHHQSMVWLGGLTMRRRWLNACRVNPVI